jgi:predicted dehydrogenase
VLSVVWIAVAALGCMSIVGMTHRVSARARLQNAADVVALAVVSRDELAARRLAERIGVTIRSVTWMGDQVTVEVAAPDGWATATAAGH